MGKNYFDENLRKFPGPEINCSYHGKECEGDFGGGEGLFCSSEEGYKSCGGPYQLDKIVLDLDREFIDVPQKL